MIKKEKHIDGEWWTSRKIYKGYLLVVKMRYDHGSKIHIMKDDKCIKTFRYSFAPADFLFSKATEFIEKKLLT